MLGEHEAAGAEPATQTSGCRGMVPHSVRGGVVAGSSPASPITTSAAIASPREEWARIKEIAVIRTVGTGSADPAPSTTSRLVTAAISHVATVEFDPPVVHPSPRWWIWQTHRSQKPAPSGRRVRPPPSAWLARVAQLAEAPDRGSGKCRFNSVPAHLDSRVERW